MRTALFILLCLGLVSCDPSKKLTRLLAKHPEWRDSLTVEAVVEYVKGDTVFTPTEADTVTYIHDRLTMKYVDRPGPTVFLQGECAADTVRQMVSVIQPTQEVTVEVIPWWIYVMGGASLLIALLALLKK